MSKLETVRALNDSGPQLQIVESVGNLQKIVKLMHEDLNQLPDAISARVAETLEPLEKLHENVTQLLPTISAIAAVQRRAIEETVQELTSKAAQAFETKAQALDGSIRDLSSSAAMLRSSIDSLEQTVSKIDTLPGRLNKAQQSMTQAADHLMQTALEMRQRPWQQPLTAALAAVAGAIIAAGMLVFVRPAPPSAAQQQAQWAQALWSRATPQERALLNQIASRPAP
jgi:ABC-type transporter Mla subunit MlaD